MQPRLQPEKKTAPDPAFPLMQGSSHACRAALASMTCAGTLQYPIPAAVRSAPHSLGQILQFFHMQSILLDDYKPEYLILIIIIMVKSGKALPHGSALYCMY